MTGAHRRISTWYCWLLTGFYLYSVNLPGNVVPFLQAEFALSDCAVSLHSSAIAVGIILVACWATGSRRGSDGGARCQGSEVRRSVALPARLDIWLFASPFNKMKQP